MMVDSESVVWHARPAGVAEAPHHAALVCRAYTATVKPVWPMIYIMSATRGQGKTAQMMQSPQENRANRANDTARGPIVDNPANPKQGRFVFQCGFVAKNLKGSLDASHGADPGLHHEGYANKAALVKCQQTESGAWPRQEKAAAGAARP